MAPERQSTVATSICHSLTSSSNQPTVLSKITSAANIYELSYTPLRQDLFASLRRTWSIKDSDYQDSFSGDDALKPMADMGYSGSTFFHTADGMYLVKSVPRGFEHSFFRDDLLEPYAAYMQNNPSSLLVRITDFLEHSQYTLGSLVGTAPSHHIVMENILYGQPSKDQTKADGEQEEKGEEGKKWQHYDLKPMSYFYPERDVAGGALASEATKSQLADDFGEEKIVLTLDQAEELKGQLEKDTKLLADCNAVDYSLFLVRIPLSQSSQSSPSPRPEPAGGDGALPPKEPPFVPPEPPSWRTGVKSADGKFVYRAAVLDFFWAKHKAQAQAMTGLINSYRMVDEHGPMSVTTTATEYRERFLGMCSEIVEVREGS